MAPMSSITEPIIRAVRDLTHAFAPLTIPSALIARLDSLERLVSSSPSSSSSSSPSSPQDHQMQKRQNDGNGMVSIPATYAFLNTSPTPGTIVGIVLGVVAGIIIVIMVVYQIFGFGYIDESEVVVEGTRRENINVVGRTGSGRGGFIRPVSNRSGGPRRVVEEMVEVRERPGSRRRHDDFGHDDDDVVVVEEEDTTVTHSTDFVEVEESSVQTSPRPTHRRPSGRRSGSYRRVDPDLAYGDDDDHYRPAR